MLLYISMRGMRDKRLTAVKRRNPEVETEVPEVLREKVQWWFII